VGSPFAGFITYKDARIYLLDIGGCTLDEAMGAITKAREEIRAEPPGSVLTLTHVAGLKIRDQTNDALRELAQGNTPYVKASAISGISSLQRVVLNMIQLVTRRRFVLFDTAEDAKDYLAALE
jgi:hypothetical protein